MRCQRNDNVRKIHDDLVQVIGDQASLCHIVASWIESLGSGRQRLKQSLKDDPQKGLHLLL